MLRLRAKSGARTVREFDALFEGSQSLFNWVQTLGLELGNAGLEDRQFHVRRIEVCEKALEMFDRNDPVIVGNFRRGIAGSWFGLGETDKTDRLYREWLKADPQWGWGWIGWSDCYWLTRQEFQNLSRGEEILQEGMKVPGVRDLTYLADRLIDLYREQGRDEEAEEVRRQFDRQEIEVMPGAKVGKTLDLGASILMTPYLHDRRRTRTSDSLPNNNARRYEKSAMLGAQASSLKSWRKGHLAERARWSSGCRHNFPMAVSSSDISISFKSTNGGAPSRGKSNRHASTARPSSATPRDEAPTAHPGLSTIACGCTMGGRFAILRWRIERKEDHRCRPECHPNQKRRDYRSVRQSRRRRF